MLYDITPVTGQLPVGVDQYGNFEYLNAYGWPILEPGGRPLDRFILSHDPELQMILATNYVRAETPYCDEGGCNISQTIPAWRSSNYVSAMNDAGPPVVLLTHAEVATLTAISGQAPPTSYDYGQPLAPFAPLQPAGPIITTAAPPVRLPPVVEFPDPDTGPDLFPVQTLQPGAGNSGPPVSPVTTGGPRFTSADTPDFGPSNMSGMTLLRLALLAYALTR